WPVGRPASRPPDLFASSTAFTGNPRRGRSGACSHLPNCRHAAACRCHHRHCSSHCVPLVAFLLSGNYKDALWVLEVGLLLFLLPCVLTTFLYTAIYFSYPLQ